MAEKRITGVPLAFVAVGVIGLLFGRTFPSQSKTLPVAVSAIMIVLALILIVQETLAARRAAPATPSGGPGSSAPGQPAALVSLRRRYLVGFALIIGYALCTYVVGAFSASALVLLVGTSLLGSRWWEAILVTALTTVVFYLFFVQLIGIPINWGLFS